MKHLLTSVTAASILAAPTVLANPTQALETTTVIGTRSELPSVALPARIQVVSAEQIKLSGAGNLVQVLNSQAGIQVNDSIGDQSRGAFISMRGFGGNSANNVLVLVDGRKMNNPSLEPADLSSISLKNVERVEIIQGSAGTLYGDQATGGVINIITKRADELAADIEAAHGTDNYETYSGSVSQAFDSGFNYRVSALKKLADNYRDNNEADYENMLANVGYRHERFELFVEAQKIDDELRLAGGLSSAQIAEDRRQTTTPGHFSNRDTETLRTGGMVKLSEQWKLLGEYSKNDADAEGAYSSPFTSVMETESLTPRVSGEIATRNGLLLVTAGIDWEDTTYDSTFNTPKGFDQTIEDVYGQVIIPATQSIDITVGGRHSEFEMQNNFTGTTHDDSLTVFQAGISVELDPGSRVFLRRDEGFRWPNADENGFTLPSVEYLEPQESTSWELGIEGQVKSLDLSAMVYQLELDNEILLDSLTYANINLDDSKRKGVVLSGLWRASADINLEANYSYTDAEIQAGAFKGNTVPFVAKETANLVFSYAVFDFLSLYLDAQYTGSRYAIGDQANTGGEIGGYTVYNANIRFEYSGAYAQLRFNNISGKEYNGYSGGVAPFDYNYPAAEESYRFTVGYHF